MTKTLWRLIGGMGIMIAVLYIQLFISHSQVGEEVMNTTPDRHIQIVCPDDDIIPDVDTYFNRQFQAGAQAAAAQYNIFAEFIARPSFDETFLTEAVEKGIYADVDGIAFSSDDSLAVGRLLTLARANNCEMLLYESENNQESNIPLVGTNSYNVGIQAGLLALEAAGQTPCKAVLIMDKSSASGTTTYRNMKMQGIVGQFSNTAGAEIVETFTLDSDMFAAERVYNAVISSQKNFNTIICLHESSTPIIAQRLIDNGLVGKINLIGYGAQTQTLDYIGRGVVYGTICPDAYAVGYNVVRLMAERFGGVNVGDYAATDLFTITRDSLSSFYAMQEGEGNGS